MSCFSSLLVPATLWASTAERVLLVRKFSLLNWNKNLRSCHLPKLFISPSGKSGAKTTPPLPVTCRDSCHGSRLNALLQAKCDWYPQMGSWMTRFPDASLFSLLVSRSTLTCQCNLNGAPALPCCIYYNAIMKPWQFYTQELHWKLCKRFSNLSRQKSIIGFRLQTFQWIPVRLRWRT